MGKLRYSVLRYSPRMEVGEAINLGVLISDKDSGKADFVFSKKKKRIESFDDELKYSAVMNLLKGIKSDVDNIINFEGFVDVDSYVTYYINAFHFDEINVFSYDIYENAVEDIKRMYLWFDYEPSKRMSKAESVNFFQNAIISKGLKVCKGRTNKGEFGDEIHYDLQTENYNIVLFDINKRNIGSQLNRAKMWSWNSKHHLSDVETIFVVKTNELSEEEYSVLMRVLDDSSAEVVPFDNAINKLSAV